jgi:hypothetical protein
MKKMLTICGHKGNTNKNHTKILPLVRIATIKNTNNNKCWPGCSGKGALVHCWWECKLVQPLQKQYGGSFKNCHAIQQYHY